MTIISRIMATRDFIEECADELSKVTWPDQAQLKSATMVVIVFVFLISAIIFVMDRASGWIIGLIMGVFGA